MVKVKDQVIEKEYSIYQGDCCEVMRGIPDNSIGFSVYSPPFAELYSYSDSERDMGNCSDYDMFFDQYDFLIKEHMRTMKPGRHVAVHCIDIPAIKERDGFIGLKDFPGDIIRHFTSAGFVYHARITIWKDPLIEAVRTKSIGLNYGQLCKDSTKARVGLPDYVIVFRKPGENMEPVTHENGIEEYHGAFKQIDATPINGGHPIRIMDSTGVGIKKQHNIFRAYASPVWFDVRQTETLNKTKARDPNDTKHICPLQLDTIERLIQLYTNPDDIVLTPFMGVGSESYVALRAGRKSIGIELKDSYYAQAKINVEKAIKEREKLTLF